MAIRYINLRPEHYDQMISAWNKSGLPIKPHGRDSREEIERRMSEFPGFFIGAFDDDTLASLVMASSDGRKGWINRLAVIPGYRGRGIARKLIKRAEQALIDSGIAIISCLVYENNHPSMALFESQGYEPWPDVVYLRKALKSDI